ncbi:TetR/AcrR family transcriptional regulator [Bacillus aquiflavi]|uniref:TetR/AcrR family transcriptional regulator n=1 Tax=Bacillus aquiflavi TaxID=2672567 RepID=A0A6B3VX54_9BACI|nr:TetR/AcrR family transcriptional regulator [Bacillus aquiflavi]MBA4536510.1 TetR/AcrR family transcriptional regulator [Bacillus aquiflavi]NEY80877.1 TetR/AcrR family transcriptional regulator [Bacillus aquiflavi]UAC49601.1 TetR/AcrR family transcriptional regulator [Bacillus aquiflavi]
MKRKITEKSIELFEKKGFSQTSIQDIVDSLQVTKGTFYYYFSSKEQLLMDIHLEYITDLLGRQQQILQNDLITNKEKLKKIMTLLIDDIKDKGANGRVFFREIRHLINENIDKIKQKRTLFRLNIEKIIQDGVNNGEFRSDLRTDMVTFGILGLTNYCYNWFNPNGEVTTEQLIDTYVEMILHGIIKA